MSLRKARITTTVDEHKKSRIEQMGITMADLIDRALDSLAPETIEYDVRIKELETQLSKCQEAESISLTRLRDVQERLNQLKTKMSDLTVEIKNLKEQRADEMESVRKAQLLREINQSIVYNEYVVPDIKKSVSKQLKEIKQLVPAFELEAQIEIVRGLY